MIRVGTSGWQYPSWRGRFYPPGLPQSSWLAHYATRFATVEVNNTFYRLPRRETFEAWRRATPAGFVVTVKASRFITHVKRLREPEWPLRAFLERAAGLGSKLGPVLFQLPPRFPADLPRLRAFLEALPGGVRAAFEFRDRSWETDEALAMLDERGAALVLADRPGARAGSVVTGGWSYVRFHQGQRLGPFYPARKLRRWAERIARLPASDVFVYFNNDAEGAAVRDAATLIRMLREQGSPVATVEGASSAASG